MTKQLCKSCKARIWVKESERKAIKEGVDYGDWITDMHGEREFYSSLDNCDCDK